MAEILDVTRTNVTEVPTEVQVNFRDLNDSYQIGAQYARSYAEGLPDNLINVSLPMALSSADGAKVAERLLMQAVNGRTRFKASLSHEYLRLSPGDIVALPYAGSTYNVRLSRVTLDPSGIVEVEGVEELPESYLSYAVGSDFTPFVQTLGLSGPSKLFLLDCPLLREQELNVYGWYVAGCGFVAGWPGAALFKSNDGGATWGMTLGVTPSQEVVAGYATTVLATADCTSWDHINTLTVRLYSGALASTTEANVLNGANSALLGVHGRWELIQFKSSVLNGDGTYTIRDFLRGRRGTEHAAGSHATYDSFILLTTATMQNMTVNAAEINALRHFKLVTSGKPLEGTAAEQGTLSAVRQKPYSPVLLGGGRDASGNLTITWKRRDRSTNAGWLNNSDVPLSETSEKYQVRIYTNNTYATLKRTLPTAGTYYNTPTGTYTSADQVTDFGSNQATVYMRVVQFSDAVGEGYPLQGAL